MPGDVFSSSDTLLYNQSLIVYTPNNTYTRELMEEVRRHSAFDVRNNFQAISHLLICSLYSQEIGGFLALPNEDAVDALFDENNMLYAAVIFHESELLGSKVRLVFHHFKT